jgi:hypothetical protein
MPYSFSFTYEDCVVEALPDPKRLHRVTAEEKTFLQPITVLKY